MGAQRLENFSLLFPHARNVGRSGDDPRYTGVGVGRQTRRCLEQQSQELPFCQPQQQQSARIQQQYWVSSCLCCAQHSLQPELTGGNRSGVFQRVQTHSGDAFGIQRSNRVRQRGRFSEALSGPFEKRFSSPRSGVETFRLDAPASARSGRWSATGGVSTQSVGTMGQLEPKASP